MDAKRTIRKLLEQFPDDCRATLIGLLLALSPHPLIAQTVANFNHGDRYESDGRGGVVYVAWVQNTGSVPLSCDVTVRGLTWSVTTAGTNQQNLQDNYSDRRRVVVYPGREGTAGFSRAVANSGRYEVACAPDQSAAQDQSAPRNQSAAQNQAATRNQSSSAPQFTPFEVAPQIRNPEEMARALQREYPSMLRDAGISGRVVVELFINMRGMVEGSRVSESSGYAQLDEAALRVASLFRFSPAMNRGQAVPVWIQVPVIFSVEVPTK